MIIKIILKKNKEWSANLSGDANTKQTKANHYFELATSVAQKKNKLRLCPVIIIKRRD